MSDSMQLKREMVNWKTDPVKLCQNSIQRNRHRKLWRMEAEGQPYI